MQWRQWLEYARAFFWTPTDEVRCRTLYTINAGPRTLRLRVHQRLYFGRWGRMRWRTERRYFTLRPIGSETHGN